MADEQKDLSIEEVGQAVLRFTGELHKALREFEKAYEAQQRELAALKERVEKLENQRGRA